MESVVSSCQVHKELLSSKGVDFDSIIELRHDIHKYPEHGYKEFETGRKIKDALIKFGVDEGDIKPCAQTGLIADICGTGENSDEGECNTIAFRADIDALHMKEETDLDYKSVTDYAHMCGHDGHIATLLATAQFWISHRDMIPKNKSIRLLFQPSEEESPGGADPMIKEGCLEGVDEVYGYHNAPLGQEGSISIKPGPLMAGISELVIEIEGKGGHGSEPAKSIDPITAAVQVHNAFNTIKSRNILNSDCLAFTICEFIAGSSDNVIPRTARMRGTIRYFDEKVKNLAIKRINQITKSISEAYDCKSEVKWSHCYPVTINHEKQAEIVISLAKECLGEENVNTTKDMPKFSSEDFSYFLNARPGAFIFLNNVKPNEEPLSLHSPYMDFNDNIISTGAYLNIKISEHRLGINLL